MVYEREFLTAVQRLHFWQYGSNPDNFTSILYTMFQKADPDNKRRLTCSFPYEAMAYQEWYDSASQDEFFEKYGLKSLGKLYDQEPSDQEALRAENEQLKKDMNEWAKEVEQLKAQIAKFRIQSPVVFTTDNPVLENANESLKKSDESS